jgi:hypothetical protein
MWFFPTASNTSSVRFGMVPAGKEGKLSNLYVYTNRPAFMEELRKQGLGFVADSVPFVFSKNTGLPKELLVLVAAAVTTGNSSIQVGLITYIRGAYALGGHQ